MSSYLFCGGRNVHVLFLYERDGSVDGWGLKKYE